jgi:hypothetical protein
MLCLKLQAMRTCTAEPISTPHADQRTSSGRGTPPYTSCTHTHTQPEWEPHRRVGGCCKEPHGIAREGERERGREGERERGREGERERGRGREGERERETAGESGRATKQTFAGGDSKANLHLSHTRTRIREAGTPSAAATMARTSRGVWVASTDTMIVRPSGVFRAWQSETNTRYTT